MQIMISKNYTGILSWGSDNYPKHNDLNKILLELASLIHRAWFQYKMSCFYRKIWQNKETPNVKLKIHRELFLTPDPYITFLIIYLNFW